MSVKNEASVRLYTKEGETRGGMTYEHVVAFDDPAGEPRTPLYVAPNLDATILAELELDFGPDMNGRLLHALGEMTTDIVFNCHKFVRIMDGLSVLTSEELGKSTNGRLIGYPFSFKQPEDYEPLTADSSKTTRIAPTELGLGQIGLIGDWSAEGSIYHSLVGLGEGDERSLQVLGFIPGDLIIANTAQVLAMHQGFEPDQNLDLFAVR